MKNALRLLNRPETDQSHPWIHYQYVVTQTVQKLTDADPGSGGGTSSHVLSPKEHVQMLQEVYTAMGEP